MQVQSFPAITRTVTSLRMEAGVSECVYYDISCQWSLIDLRRIVNTSSAIHAKKQVEDERSAELQKS